MRKPVQDRKCDDFPLALFLSAASHPLWDLLLNALMRSCPVKERDVFFEHPIQLTVAHNQQMIETFKPHTAKKSLAHGVRRGARKGVRKHSIPEALATNLNAEPNLRSLSRIKRRGA